MRHIARLRKARKLTPYRLAKLAGISRSHLMAIEAGRTDPTVGTLTKIAKALGVSAADLLR
jgi:HTH-type transcriptional regulator, repressor for puuD